MRLSTLAHWIAARARAFFVPPVDAGDDHGGMSGW
jgi:hypothetical protein